MSKDDTAALVSNEFRDTCWFYVVVATLTCTEYDLGLTGQFKGNRTLRGDKVYNKSESKSAY